MGVGAGQPWRSSRRFLMVVAVFSLFSEKLLYGFLVPIMKEMTERLGIPSSYTQTITTATLALHGLCSLISSPVVAHFADKTPDRRHFLLTSLMGCIVGTLLIACTSSGRTFQAISGSATWIASYAMFIENTAPEQRGQTLALATSIVSSGTICGPIIAGTVFQLAGYWAVWSVPIALLGLNVIFRLAMVDRAPRLSLSPKEGLRDPAEIPEPRESDSLLSGLTNGYETMEQNSSETDSQRSDRYSSDEDGDSSDDETVVPPEGFYHILLFDPRIWAGLANTFGQALIVAAFDATLPLFLRTTFDWGSAPVGVIFLGIQGPQIFLGPVVGRIRDRVGSRFPTVLGWTLVAPFLLLLALAGTAGGASSYGEALAILSIVGIGFGFLLIRGSGSLQLIAVTTALEEQNSGVLGPNKGVSKVSALLEMAFNVGMLLGPLIFGSLSEIVGYFYMNCLMALIALFVALVSQAYII